MKTRRQRTKDLAYDRQIRNIREAAAEGEPAAVALVRQMDAATALENARAARWKTQSVLLPKSAFPTRAHAVAWLRGQRVPYKADRIEDSAIKPGGLPEGAGLFWRARQFNPHPGRVVRTLPIGAQGILLVREMQP